MGTLDAAGCRAFLLDTSRPAMVATVRADGRPHVAPVWVDIDPRDPDVIVFMTGADSVKGAALRRDPRICVALDDDQPPYAFVVADGVAELSEDLAELRAWGARLGGRYLGADQADALGARNGVPGELLVRVRVRHWVGQDGVAD